MLALITSCYAAAPSPYLPGTPGGPPMTPGVPSYLPGTPGGQPMTPGTGALDPTSPAIGKCENKNCECNVFVFIDKYMDLRSTHGV